MNDKKLQLFKDVTGAEYDASNSIHREGMRRLEYFEKEIHWKEQFYSYITMWTTIGVCGMIIGFILMYLKH